jgi:hypothetical protein
VRQSILYCVAAFLTLASTSNAAIIRFNSDPFAGSAALTTPGRQIVGGEPSIDLNIGTDVFAFNERFFNVGPISFVNDVIGNVPPSGVNFIVLETFDNDADPMTPFGAGNAANLIAAQITSSGAGFFIYFNSGLNLPRLVYSTDLDDNTADLKILARFTNLLGQSDALPSFTAANAVVVPEPSGALLMMAAGVLCACGYAARRARARYRK